MIKNRIGKALLSKLTKANKDKVVEQNIDEVDGQESSFRSSDEGESENLSDNEDEVGELPCQRHHRMRIQLVHL